MCRPVRRRCARDRLRRRAHPRTTGRRRAAPGRRHRPDGRVTPAGVDDEHSGIGDHREPVGAVAVEHEARRAVENPPLGVAVRGDTAVDRGARLASGRTGRRPAARTGSSSPRTASDRSRGQVPRADGQLDDALGPGKLRPTLIDVPLPQRAGVDAAFGDLPNKGRWALFRQRLSDRLAPHALVIAELKKQLRSPFPAALRTENTVLVLRKSI